jgi:hypothetical protein
VIHIDINHVYDNISDEQMEILLRRWVKSQLQRLAKREHSLILDIDIAYGSDPADITSCVWKLGYSGDCTSGELLHDVVTEYNRRLEFAECCKLRMIEGPAASPPGDIAWDDPSIVGEPRTKNSEDVPY